MAAATKKKATKQTKKSVSVSKSKSVKKAVAPKGEFYSVVEIANQEQVSMKTVYTWILERKIKAEKDGRTYRIPKKTYVRPVRVKKS